MNRNKINSIIEGICGALVCLVVMAFFILGIILMIFKPSSAIADINEGKVVDKQVEACFNETVNYSLIINVKYERDGKEKSSLKTIKVSEDTYFEVNVGAYIDDLSALESKEI